MSDVKIYRVYNSGTIQDETFVLQPHFVFDEGHKDGYDGDVDAWSEHNKKYRFGCAQIVLEDGEYKVPYTGYLDGQQIDEAIAELKKRNKS